MKRTEIISNESQIFRDFREVSMFLGYVTERMRTLTLSNKSEKSSRNPVRTVLQPRSKAAALIHLITLP